MRWKARTNLENLNFTSETINFILFSLYDNFQPCLTFFPQSTMCRYWCRRVSEGRLVKATVKSESFQLTYIAFSPRLNWILQVPNLLLIPCSMLAFIPSMRMTTSFPRRLHDKFIFAYNKCPPCAIEKSSRHKMGRWFVSLWNVDSHMKSIIGVRGEISVCHLNRVVTWKIETTSCTREKSSKLSLDIYNTQRGETSHFALLIKVLETSWIWITSNGSKKREKTWIAQKAESGKLYVGYEIKAKGNYTSNENYFNISSFPSFSFIELTHSHSFVLLSLSWN